MPWWWVFPVGGAFLLSVVLTDLVRIWATKRGIVDVPNGGRKQHDAPTPLAGGVGLYLAVAIPTIIVLVTSDHFTAGEMGIAEFFGFLLGGAVLVVGGVLDDKYDLPPRLSFAFPLLAAMIATVSGIGVAKLTNPLGDFFVLAPSFSAVFTLLWLLATTYTTKLLDGLDGLSSSIGALGTLMIAFLALSDKFFQPDVALLALMCFAAIVGFLTWNARPAHIFLGEGGSTFLGFIIGVLGVIAGGKVATTLLVLGVPALDVAFVILRRLRQGKNPFTTSDRSHLHHLLLDRGMSQRQVVLLYATVAVGFGVLTLVLTSWQKVVALGILGLVTGIGVLFLERGKQK